MSSAGCANVNEEEKSCRVQSYHIIRLQYFIYFRWGEVLSLQQLLAWQAATVRRLKTAECRRPQADGDKKQKADGEGTRQKVIN